MGCLELPLVVLPGAAHAPRRRSNANGVRWPPAQLPETGASSG